MKFTYVELSCGIKIALSIDYPWKDNLIRELGDIEFVGKVTKENTNSVTSSLEVIPLHTMSFLDAKYSFFDNKYKVLLQINPDGRFILKSRYPCYEWFFWIIQLALLRNKFTFIHGGCFEKNGKAILIASKGGVGKTAITAYFVNKLNWKFLGDDLIIVDETGKCFAFPKPMVLYPYHKVIFPEFFERGIKPTAPVWSNYLFDIIVPKIKPFIRKLSEHLLEFARQHNPQSKKVKPSMLFNPNVISKEATIQKIFWLDRKVNSNLEIISDDGTLASRLLAGTLLEFDQHCVKSSLLGIRDGIINAEPIFSIWLDILNQFVRNSAQSNIINIPKDVPLDKLGLIIAEYISGGEER